MIETVSIPYKRNSEALGRNGIMKAIGLEMGVFPDDLVIRPINSKKTTGRCHIGIDYAALPEIIAALTVISKERSNP